MSFRNEFVPVDDQADNSSVGTLQERVQITNSAVLGWNRLESDIYVRRAKTCQVWSDIGVLTTKIGELGATPGD